MTEIWTKLPETWVHLSHVELSSLVQTSHFSPTWHSCASVKLNSNDPRTQCTSWLNFFLNPLIISCLKFFSIPVYLWVCCHDMVVNWPLHSYKASLHGQIQCGHTNSLLWCSRQEEIDNGFKRTQQKWQTFPSLTLVLQQVCNNMLFVFPKQNYTRN